MASPYAFPKIRPTGSVDAWFKQLPDTHQGIIAGLRELVRKADEDLEETVKWGHPCYVREKIVCSIVPFRSHVNLAFFRGAELVDPAGLLEGTGKGMRHIKLRTAGDIRRQLITGLLHDAVRLDGQAQRSGKR